MTVSLLHTHLSFFPALHCAASKSPLLFTVAVHCETSVVNSLAISPFAPSCGSWIHLLLCLVGTLSLEARFGWPEGSAACEERRAKANSTGGKPPGTAWLACFAERPVPPHLASSHLVSSPFVLPIAGLACHFPAPHDV